MVIGIAGVTIVEAGSLVDCIFIVLQGAVSYSSLRGKLRPGDYLPNVEAFLKGGAYFAGMTTHLPRFYVSWIKIWPSRFWHIRCPDCWGPDLKQSGFVAGKLCACFASEPDFQKCCEVVFCMKSCGSFLAISWCEIFGVHSMKLL